MDGRGDGGGLGSPSAAPTLHPAAQSSGYWQCKVCVCGGAGEGLLGRGRWGHLVERVECKTPLKPLKVEQLPRRDCGTGGVQDERVNVGASGLRRGHLRSECGQKGETSGLSTRPWGG